MPLIMIELRKANIFNTAIYKPYKGGTHALLKKPQKYLQALSGCQECSEQFCLLEAVNTYL